MFCSNCGSKIENNNGFCTVCGATLESPVVRQMPQSDVEYVQPVVVNSVPNDDSSKWYDTLSFKFLLIFIVGTAISFVASMFIPFAEINFVIMGFFILTIISLLVFLLGLINQYISHPANFDFMVTSFVMSIVVLLFKYYFCLTVPELSAYAGYLQYIAYFLMGLGFLSMFILMCRKIFKK